MQHFFLPCEPQAFKIRVSKFTREKVVPEYSEHSNPEWNFSKRSQHPLVTPLRTPQDKTKLDPPSFRLLEAPGWGNKRKGSS